jgi:hypothetical protein
MSVRVCYVHAQPYVTRSCGAKTVCRCRLKRMSDQAYREQCVATATEVAAPMPSDDPATARIRPLLAHTRLETAQLRCGIPLVSNAQGCAGSLCVWLKGIPMQGRVYQRSATPLAIAQTRPALL